MKTIDELLDDLEDASFEQGDNRFHPSGETEKARAAVDAKIKEMQDKASAPDLLEAAKAALFVLKIVHSHTKGTNEAGAIARLEDAIAKAEGRAVTTTGITNA